MLDGTALDPGEVTIWEEIERQLEGKVEKIDIFNESILIKYENDSYEKMSLIDAMNILKKQDK